MYYCKKSASKLHRKKLQCTKPKYYVFTTNNLRRKVTVVGLKPTGKQLSLITCGFKYYVLHRCQRDYPLLFLLRGQA